MQEIIFPQYRKYKNNRSYFKIHSRTQWEEIQVVGKKHVLNQFTVKILPDRNFIHDLLFDYEKNWEQIDEKEYQRIKDLC